MKLSYSVMAFDDSGVALKEVLQTFDESKALDRLDELENALMSKPRCIKGVQVAYYTLVKEPM